MSKPPPGPFSDTLSNVFINFNMVHATIVFITIKPLPDLWVILHNHAEEIRMIRSVKFVSVPVTDQDQALAFYTEKLGFRLATDQPFDDKQCWIELAIPGAQTGVVLFRMEGGPQAGSRMNLSFWADDVEGTAQTHKNRGVHFLAEPQRESWGTSAIFQDPDGNSFVLSSK